MKHFKFSHLLAAAALVACLSFTSCKPADDATQVIQQQYSAYAQLFQGTWKSQYNDGYTFTGASMVYDDGGYGYGWTRTIVEYSDKYIYTVDANGKYYATGYKNYTGTACKFANAYKAGGKTSADSLADAKAEFTVENGYYAMYGDYSKK